MAESSEEKRAQLRKEIKETSKEEFILKEMKRLGFWPDDKEQPTLAEEFINKRAELSTQIKGLTSEDKRFKNKEAVLRKYKKERMKKSREQQKLNKEKREADRLEKQQIWKAKQANDIIYLGEKYTNLLHKKESNTDLLKGNNLPAIADVKTLATHLETTLSELRYLSFHRYVSTVSHYIRYQVPKKAGGHRKIAAPMPRLKKVQRAILDKLLSKVKVSDYAHGFTENRSIVTNAKPHINQAIVVNMDLKDFFPTLDYKRVFGMFKALGFSPQQSTVLTLVCTETVEEKIKVDGAVYYVNEGERVLPQGAPTSPAITNIICRKMDQRLAGIAKKLGFTYTRYADDMTFSGPKELRSSLNKLMWQVKAVIKNEDFQLHPMKTRIMTTGARKEVTGIVVNEKASVPRKKLKAFRALLFQIEKDGPANKSWGNSPDLLASIEGFARFVYMVDPKKGSEFLARVAVINNRYKPKKTIIERGIDRGIKEIKKRIDRSKKDQDQSGKPWWKIW